MTSTGVVPREESVLKPYLRFLDARVRDALLISAGEPDTESLG